MPFSDLTICSKSKLDKDFKSFGASHVLSILDPYESVRKPFRLKPQNHKKIHFDDVFDASAEFAPEKRHLIEIRNWLRNLPKSSRLVIHCTAGVSRSTAVAYMALLDEIDSKSALERVFSIQPEAKPNKLIMEIIAQGLDE